MLCSNAFLCIAPACQKNSGGNIRGGYTLENCIPFCFSCLFFFFPPRDFASQLKGCVSQHYSNVLTPQLWAVKIGTKKNKTSCQRMVLWCQWTLKVQHERGDLVYVGVHFLTPSPRCYSSLTLNPRRWIMANGQTFLVCCTLWQYLLCIAFYCLFCTQISTNALTVLSFCLLYFSL